MPMGKQMARLAIATARKLDSVVMSRIVAPVRRRSNVGLFPEVPPEALFHRIHRARRLSFALCFPSHYSVEHVSPRLRWSRSIFLVMARHVENAQIGLSAISADDILAVLIPGS